MNGYQDAEGNQLFGDDSGGDVLDFEPPQASSSRSSFDQASQSSFDQMAFTPFNQTTQSQLQPFASSSSLTPSSLSTSLFPLSPSLVPAFEELGLMTASPPSYLVGDARTRTSDHDMSSACPICGNEAGRHNHYGGRACTSCRAFFRRSVQVWAIIFPNLSRNANRACYCSS